MALVFYKERRSVNDESGSPHAEHGMGRLRVVLGEGHCVSTLPSVRDAEFAAQILVPDIVAFIVDAQSAGVTRDAGANLLEEIDLVLLEHGRANQAGVAFNAHPHGRILKRPDVYPVQWAKQGHFHITRPH
jgi:hypothetical protein